VHIELLGRLRNDFGAEVIGQRVPPPQQLRQHALLEHVDAHGGNVGLLLRLLGGQAQHGRIHLLHKIIETKKVSL